MATIHPPLTIRATQLEAFRPELEQQFIDLVCAWIADRHPDPSASMSPDQRAERVASCVRRAKGYGFRSKRDISLFVALDWRLGFEFERTPALAWAQALLAHEGLSPATRLHRVECRLERLAQVAADNLRDETDA